MKNKIIFFDADGTTIKGYHMTKRVYDTIQKLRSLGCIMVLCTGRAMFMINGPLERLKLDHMICSAGGIVIADKKIISHNYIKKEHLKEIIDYFDSYGLLYHLECNDHNYIIEGTRDRHLRRLNKMKIENHENYLTIKGNIERNFIETDDPLSLKVNKIHWYEYEEIYDNKTSPLTYQSIKEHFINKYNIVPLSLTKDSAGGEINEKDITKRKGMEILVQYFHIDKDNIYAIGDDYNDREMLTYATHSIAMGHAPEEIKKICEYVSYDYEHDGFVQAMKHYHLI